MAIEQLTHQGLAIAAAPATAGDGDQPECQAEPQTPGQGAGGHLGKADRHVDQRIGILAACLDQADAGRRIFRQPCGQHTARRPTSYDDVIISLRHVI